LISAPVKEIKNETVTGFLGKAGIVIPYELSAASDGKDDTIPIAELVKLRKVAQSNFMNKIHLSEAVDVDRNVPLHDEFSENRRRNLCFLC
jgi:hypothetical protein